MTRSTLASKVRQQVGLVLVSVNDVDAALLRKPPERPPCRRSIGPVRGSRHSPGPSASRSRRSGTGRRPRCTGSTVSDATSGSRGPRSRGGSCPALRPCPRRCAVRARGLAGSLSVMRRLRQEGARASADRRQVPQRTPGRRASAERVGPGRHFGGSGHAARPVTRATAAKATNSAGSPAILPQLWDRRSRPAAQ